MTTVTWSLCHFTFTCLPKEGSFLYLNFRLLYSFFITGRVANGRERSSDVQVHPTSRVYSTRHADGVQRGQDQGEQTDSDIDWLMVIWWQLIDWLKKTDSDGKMLISWYGDCWSAHCIKYLLFSNFVRWVQWKWDCSWRLMFLYYASCETLCVIACISSWWCGSWWWWGFSLKFLKNNYFGYLIFLFIFYYIFAGSRHDRQRDSAGVGHSAEKEAARQPAM